MKLIYHTTYYFFPKLDVLEGNIVIRKSQYVKQYDYNTIPTLHYTFILWADFRNNICKVKWDNIEQTYFKMVDYKT